jgi:hypothetical protein
MAVEQFANNASSTLNGAINSSVTSLVVTSATGFPTVGNFRLLIDSEIMLVTAVSGTTFTVTRGIEGTAAASHSNGATVTAILTAGSLAAWAASIIGAVNEFRVTTESGKAVSTTDRTSQGDLFLTPITDSGKGVIALPDGIFVTDELTFTLTGTTRTPGNQYDLICYIHSGSIIFDMTPPWTNDTARSVNFVGAGGMRVNATSFVSEIGNTISAGKARLVGSMRLTGTQVTEDSEARRFISSADNLRPRRLRAADTSGLYVYTTATYRQQNVATIGSEDGQNQVSAMVCVPTFIDISKVFPVTGTGIQPYAAIGQDSTTPDGVDVQDRAFGYSAAGAWHLLQVRRTNAVPIGKHMWVPLEKGSSGATWGTVDNGTGGVMQGVIWL